MTTTASVNGTGTSTGTNEAPRVECRTSEEEAKLEAKVEHLVRKTKQSKGLHGIEEQLLLREQQNDRSEYIPERHVHEMEVQKFSLLTMEVRSTWCRGRVGSLRILLSPIKHF